MAWGKLGGSPPAGRELLPQISAPDSFLESDSRPCFPRIHSFAARRTTSIESINANFGLHAIGRAPIPNAIAWGAAGFTQACLFYTGGFFTPNFFVPARSRDFALFDRPITHPAAPTPAATGSHSSVGFRGATPSRHHRRGGCFTSQTSPSRANNLMTI